MIYLLDSMKLSILSFIFNGNVCQGDKHQGRAQGWINGQRWPAEKSNYSRHPGIAWYKHRIKPYKNKHHSEINLYLYFLTLARYLRSNVHTRYDFPHPASLVVPTTSALESQYSRTVYLIPNIEAKRRDRIYIYTYIQPETKQLV